MNGNYEDRIERLETAVVEIRNIMRILAGNDTWQYHWDKLDKICSDIQDEAAQLESEDEE